MGSGGATSGSISSSRAKPSESASKGIGAYERANTGAKETSTVRTGSKALKITGPGVQDFDVPVSAASTTVTVYGRYDGTYTGTKPQMFQIASAGETVVSIGLEIRVGETSGMMSVCLPSRMLKIIRNRFD